MLVVEGEAEVTVGNERSRLSRIADVELVERWNEVDVMGLMQQPDVIPTLVQG